MRFAKLCVAAALLLTVFHANAAGLEGFDKRYTVRTGDFNSDGRTDVYLQYNPQLVQIPLDDLTIPIPLPGPVSDFVLQQNTTGGFVAVGINSTQRSALSQWALAQAVQLIFGDYNMDGRLDILVKNVASAISGAQDAFVFGPSTNGAVPAIVKPLDEPVRMFLRDSMGWVEDYTHFDSGVYQACYYAGYAYVPVMRYDELGYYWTYEWMPVIECGYYFDPTGFSIPAINFLNALIAPTNNGQLVPGSQNAITLSTILQSVLGTPIMRSSLEAPANPNEDPTLPEQCRTPSANDAATNQYCNSFYIARVWGQFFNWLGTNRVVNCFDFETREHHYEIDNAICTIGTPRCNAAEVYQNEQLVHPVTGYWDKTAPIYNVATASWNPPAPLGYARMGCTTEVPKACDLMGLFDGGPIRFEVEPAQHLHRNITMEGHIFHPGTITRNTHVTGNQVFIKTVGGGTGLCPKTNEVSGAKIFNSVDQFIICHMKGSCQAKHPVGQ